MTRSLVWKELRQQWAVWLTMAVTAGSLVTALRAVLSPGLNRDELLVSTLWLSAWAYGLVCGSLLLAIESEDQTQTFLETLPGTRRRLWRAKVSAGLGLLAAQALVLCVISYLSFSPERLSFPAGFDLAGIPAFGVAGFAFGLWGGARSASVLGGIGRGVTAQAVILLTLFPFLALTIKGVALLILGVDPSRVTLPFAPLVALAMVAAAAAFRSRQTYCQLDRLRAAALRGRGARLAEQDWGEAFRLACWDARWFALGIAALGVCGLALKTEGMIDLPPLVACIGLVCGLSALSGSKDSAALDGTGEPAAVARRDLFARVAVRFAVAYAVSLLTALAWLVLTRSVRDVDQVLYLSQQVPLSYVPWFYNAQSHVFLPAWLVNGFAVGLMCGLFARSSLATGLLAVVGGFLLVRLWLIFQFIFSQATAWHVLGVPAVLLAAALATVFASTRVRSEGRVAILLTTALVTGALATSLWLVAAA
jgi:hypothetical protein